MLGKKFHIGKGFGMISSRTRHRRILKLAGKETERRFYP
jgi:hypothetical protein